MFLYFLGIISELLYNGTSSKVADAVQGLMAANKGTKTFIALIN